MARIPLRSRKGISTIYSSLIFFTLVFSILTLLISNYFNYNNTLQDKMSVEQERFLEHLFIANLTIDKISQTISSLLVNNTGTIDVKIRAIYIASDTKTYLACDPSTYMDSHISPHQSLIIPLPSNVTVEPDAEITVVTERGVMTKQYEGVLIFGTVRPVNYDTRIFNIGPVQLRFDAFCYRQVIGVTFDLNDYWHPGWSINTGFGYCGWNITVKNIGNKNLTLNKFSSLTLLPNDSPSSELSWYIQPSNSIQFTESLAVNQTKDIIFIFTSPKSGQAQKMNLPQSRCMAFLTFFGTYSENDGSTTPYAQTIPFEAVKVV